MVLYFGLQFCNGLSGEDLVCRYEPEKQVVQNKHLCLPQVYLNMILNDTTQYYPKCRITISLIFLFRMKSIRLTSG